MRRDIPTQDLEPSDEITLIDLWERLVARRGWLMGVSLMGIAAAITYALSARPLWQAVAIIQIGQIFQTPNSLVIEPAPKAVERIRLKPFQGTVLQALGVREGEETPDRTLYMTTIKAKVVSGTDLIELKLQAPSRQQARQWAEATVNHLSVVHQRLAGPSILRLNQQLQELKRQIKVTEMERDELIKSSQLRPEIGPGNRFAENLLFLNYLVQKNAELRQFENRKLELEEQLSPAKTFPTSLLEGVHVTGRPVHPRKLLIVILGAALGLFAGTIVALVLSVRDKRRQPQ